MQNQGSSEEHEKCNDTEKKVKLAKIIHDYTQAKEEVDGMFQLDEDDENLNIVELEQKVDRI